MTVFKSGAWRRFASDRTALAGLCGIALLLLPALYAPLLANGRPLLFRDPESGWELPFLRYCFAPDSTESLMEQCFNYLALLLPALMMMRVFPRRWRRPAGIGAALLLLLPFLLVPPRLDRTDYRNRAEHGAAAVFAPIPYGPNEIAARPSEPPSLRHWCGADAIGRDVAARLIYGARASLAVGIFATGIALLIGTAAGLAAGFYRGWFDLLAMRAVEVLLCFPTFLLLLILMSILGDYKFQQSIPVVVAVIGLTGWIGLALLVRGETLRQSALPYIAAGIVAGLPVRRILFHHLLPNIHGPILISFTFGVAGAILAESGLSFLGFGVQAPTASWGGLLRQAFDNPLEGWHLTFFPGLALFIAVLSFNFTGEGLRRMFAPR